ncbi:MAG: hypothetical protein JWO71_1186 [Candidatus Acidoferrum typicum]|nr:hypothetical protein [Candidatus Acidoferrum typicum]
MTEIISAERKYWRPLALPAVTEWFDHSEVVCPIWLPIWTYSRVAGQVEGTADNCWGNTRFLYLFLGASCQLAPFGSNSFGWQWVAP